MAFLSILLIPLILVPFFVTLGPELLRFVDLCDLVIVLFFVLEYGSKLYLAADRRAHFRSPWHLVDLAIVLLSVFSYLPLVGLNAKGSLALLVRLVRLPRAFALMGRTAGSRVQASETRGETEGPEPETVIRQVDPDLTTRHDHLSWDDVALHLKDGRQAWIDIHHVSPEGIARLSRMLGVPEPHFKSRVVDEIYPHVVAVQDLSLVFVQSGEVRYPEHAGRRLRIERTGVVVVCAGPKILSISAHGTDLFEEVLGDARQHLHEGSFLVSVLYGIVAGVLNDYRAICDEIELEIGKIAGVPKSKLPRDFLERMYALAKETTRVGSNLLHFRQMVASFATKRLALEGFDKKAVEDFEVLAEEAQFLDETADDLSERVQSLIDLYINQESFETNRVLKILAVITSLAVIPAVVSGILGQNLLGQPFDAQLWQVVAGIALASSFVLYCFFKLGWLRT
jgi:Mg2+ and Co2+ transporter CorA